MLRSASDRRAGDTLAIVADPLDRRVELFQRALLRSGHRAAHVVDYRDLLAAHGASPASPGTDRIVRLESPGRARDLEQAFLARGADAAEAEGSPSISGRALGELVFEKGRIVSPRQWYLGFRSVLEELERDCGCRGATTFTSQPKDVALMFDKVACHERLHRAGVRVPRSPGPVGSFDELRAEMRRHEMGRVFVKLRHGSAASGVVAYETDFRREQAWTTVELVAEHGETRLYNSRRLRRYRSRVEIESLIDTLCRHGVHVETWLPKADVDGCVSDLRVLVVKRQPTHIVLRLGKGPITNLHLGAQRGTPQGLAHRMGPRAWGELLETCRRCGDLFPRTLHVALDVAVDPGLRRHAVLEVNAFGDLLKGVRHRGLDPYDAQVAAMFES